ncbi:MAG TPA: endolytic transglycosylase MltG [Kofleriaceae bacterium]|nr:endolytic transglycosylase MltG [Kofleriaceae bacterium]
MARPKRSFRIALYIVVGTAALLVLAAALAVRFALHYPDSPRDGDGTEIAVTIEPGMTFPEIAARLEKSHVVDDARWLRIYAMHRGVTRLVRSGHYTLADNMTPKAVIDALLAGVPAKTVSVTIPEGLNMLEVFAIYDKAGVATAESLLELARDPEFLARHGISGSSVDGYLFPETYRVRVPSSPETVLDTMIKEHRIVWDDVRRKHHESLAKLRKKLGWTDRQFLILASIVEKEAAVDSERPRIAQVFVNRLLDASFSPKLLETDPTIRYGCMVPITKSAACQAWTKTDRLHTAQLHDADNPYNTYEHEGLPPGPICNPGREALAAAADPDGSRYFFFVGRNDGTHVFSRTVAEHNRAVDKYQR